RHEQGRHLVVRPGGVRGGVDECVDLGGRECVSVAFLADYVDGAHVGLVERATDQVDFAGSSTYAGCIPPRGPTGVSIPLRILFVLLPLRLLVPPGICLCKLSSPASRFLAGTLGAEPVPVPVEHDDHHEDGCPVSSLNEAMGLRPAGPGPI